MATELDFSGRFRLRLADVPPGVKRVAGARAVRWFGWGFGETLLPVFILMFTTSLTEAGLINSAYDFIFLVSLPFVGFLADAVSSKTLLIIGLLIYPFIGISYYLAGALGLVLFVILGKALNGLSYCLDTVATDTYIRRLSPRRAIASSFGYTASLANGSWLAAALIGAWLVRFVPLNELLLLVTPFSLLALIPFIGVKRDKPESKGKLGARALLAPLSRFLKEAAGLRRGLRHVVFLMFLFDFVSVASTFFIPIAAYKSGASLSAVAILCVLAAAPSLAEFWLAEFIDGSRAKRKNALIFALGALPFLFLAASLLTGFSARILIAFGIEVAAVFGSLALQSYATMLSRRERYGEISSMLEGASTLGDLSAPLAIGMLTDALGFGPMFALAAVLLLFVAFYFFRYPIER
jgi:MFS family permease